MSKLEQLKRKYAPTSAKTQKRTSSIDALKDKYTPRAKTQEKEPSSSTQAAQTPRNLDEKIYVVDTSEPGYAAKSPVTTTPRKHLETVTELNAPLPGMSGYEEYSQRAKKREMGLDGGSYLSFAQKTAEAKNSSEPTFAERERQRAIDSLGKKFNVTVDGKTTEITYGQYLDAVAPDMLKDFAGEKAGQYKNPFVEYVNTNENAAVDTNAPVYRVFGNIKNGQDVSDIMAAYEEKIYGNSEKGILSEHSKALNARDKAYADLDSAQLALQMAYLEGELDSPEKKATPTKNNKPQEPEEITVTEDESVPSEPRGARSYRNHNEPEEIVVETTYDAPTGEYNAPAVNTNRSYVEDAETAFENAKSVYNESEEAYKKAEEEYKRDVYYYEGLKTFMSLSDSDKAVIQNYCREMAYTQYDTIDAALGPLQKYRFGRAGDMPLGDVKKAYFSLKEELENSGLSADEITRMEKTISAYYEEAAANATQNLVTNTLEYHDSPLLTGAFNIARIPAALNGGMLAATDTLIVQPLENLGKSEGFKAPVNYNSAATHLKTSTDAVKEYTSEEIKVNYGEAASFAYDVLVSVGDSVAAGFAGPAAGAVVLGSGAAYDAAKDAHHRGASDEQAWLTGVLAGVYETFFEKVSLGNLQSLQDISSATWKEFLKSAAKSSAVNASEEFFTDAANIITDLAVNREHSEFYLSYQEYAKEHSSNEAWLLALKDTGKRLGLTTLAGAASGGVMSGSFGGYNFASNYAANDIIGSSFVGENGSIDIELANTLIAQGLSSENTDIKQYATSIKDASKVDAKQLGNLQRMIIEEQGVPSYYVDDNGRIQEESYNTLLTVALSSKDARTLNYAKRLGNRAIDRVTPSEIGVLHNMVSATDRSSFSKAGRTAFDIAMKGAKDKATAARQFEIKYREGELGYAFEVDNDSELTPSMQEAAYKYGAEAAKTVVEDATADSLYNPIRATGDLETKSYNQKAGTLYVEDGVAVTSDLVKISKSVAKDLQVPVSIVKTLGGTRGFYITDSGGIVVAADATVRIKDSSGKLVTLKGTEAAQRIILGHELTHRLKAAGSDAFTKFERFVRANVANVDKVVAKYMKVLDLDETAAFEELVCDYAMINLFSDAKLAKEITTKHSKIAEIIRDFFEWVRAKLGIKGKELSNIEYAAKLWNDAYNAAARGGKRGAKTKNTADGDVKWSSGATSTGVIDLSKDNKLSAMVDGIYGSKRYSIIKNYILDELKDQPITLSDGKKAVVDNRDAQHIAAHKSSSKEAAEISRIKEIVERAKLVAEENSTKDRKFDYFWYYEASVKFGKETFPIYVNVGRAKNDSSYHIYDLTKKIRDTAHRVYGVERPVGNALLNDISIDMVPQDSDGVKSDLSQESTNGTKKSVTGTEDILYSSSVDSNGDTLTEQQAEYFAGSQERDANGNLNVMYRGDSAEINVFDRKKSKSGNLYGRGFYFTNSKAHASQYGDARAFYVNAKNPLSPEQNAITKAQMRRFLKAVAENEDYSFENYGQGATVDTVLEDMFGKGDFEMLQDVSATAIGDLVEAVELFNDVNGTEYDSIRVPTETVIFSSEQAKLTSNKTPTSNPDIRHSTTGTEDILYADLENTKATPYKRTTESYREELDALNEEIRSINLFEGDALANMQRRNKLIAKAKRIESIIKKRLAPKIESNDAIDSDAFISWFGNWRNGTSRSSKVVDEEGKPLIVYHGTGTTIEEFLPEFTGQGTDQYGSGFYFTTDISTANGYTTRTLNEQAKLGGTDNPNVIPAYLNIRRPLVIDATKTANLYSIDVSSSAAARIISKMPDIMDEENSILGDYFEEYWNGGPRKYMITQLAEEYDWTLGTLATDIFRDYPTEFRQAVKDVLGYDGIQVNFASGEKHFIAWFPNQIKHATENNGAFSKKDNRIKYSTAGTEDILFESEAEKAQYVADSFDLSGAENFKAAGSMERMSNIANSIAKAHRVNKDGRTKLANALEKGVQNMRKAAKSDDAKVKQTAAEGFLEAAMVISPDADVQAQVEIANALAESVWAEMTTDRLPDTIRSIRDDAIKAARAEVRADRLAALGEKYGTIKPGERPSRVVTLPKKTSEGKKVSQTVRTVMEAEATPDEMLPTIEQMVADGEFSYTPYTDKEAIANAEKAIVDGGFEDTLSKWYRTIAGGEVSKDNTALGFALYNAAANAGDFENAIEILQLLSKHQKSAGQAVQATRILKKMSSSAEMYYVQKSIEDMQSDIDKRYGDGTVLRIDPELAKQYKEAVDEEERAKIIKNIYRDIGRQMPPGSLREKLNALRYTFMLGNARTIFTKNMGGNLAFWPVVKIKDTLDIILENGISLGAKAISKVSGKPLEYQPNIAFVVGDKALLKAAKADYARVQDEALGETKYSDSRRYNKDVEEGHRLWQETKFKTDTSNSLRNVAAKIINTTTRAGAAVLNGYQKGVTAAMEKGDMFFSKRHYTRALAHYCKAHGITAKQVESGKGIEKARAYAIKEAQKATFRDTNALSYAFGKLGRWNENSEENYKRLAAKSVNIIVESNLPFRKTPANMFVRGVEYSPLFLLRLPVNIAKVKSGEMTAAEAIDDISAGLTGTGLFALGMYLAAQGFVRGIGGDDDKEKDFEELMGHQQYALEIGNTSVTLDWLAPEALPFFVGVNFAEMQARQGGEVSAANIIDTVSMITEPMLEMSCLQSVNSVLESLEYSDNKIFGFLYTTATNRLLSYIPSWAGQIERTFESERMTSYTSKGNKWLTTDMQYTLGKASAKMPVGWDYNQIPYIDAWGRTEANGNFVERAFNNFVNPAYTSTIKESDMEKELLRLYEQTGEPVLPNRADKSFPIDGEQVYLTAEQYQTYATSKGKRSHRLLTSLTKSEFYSSLDDFTKAEIVSKIYSYSNAMAKSACGAKNKSDKGYALDGWVSKAYDACAKYGIDEATYIAAYIVAGNAGKYVSDGKTVDDSPGLCKMKAVYNTFPDLTQEQYRAMFVNFTVGSNVRGDSKETVEKKIADFNEDYEYVEKERG